MSDYLSAVKSYFSSATTLVTGGAASSSASASSTTPAKESFSVLEISELMNIAHALASIGQQVEMPRLVVVGSQSAGKSTVLNSLIGFDFLPTGGQMVTRLPLNLQLIPIELEPEMQRAEPERRDSIENNTGAAAAPSTTTAVVTTAAATAVQSSPTQAASPAAAGASSTTTSTNTSGSPGSYAVVDFGEYTSGGIWKVTQSFRVDFPRPSAAQLKTVRDHIEHETSRIAGDKKNISANSLNVKITAPHVTPLSVTDLPGLTMHALTDQGQPSDIPAQIRQLVMSHIRQERTIIVAVLPAREDLEADPAMAIVKSADPDGKRTVGVLTKVDLMNKGTDISRYLAGTISESLKFELGYYAVRNRAPNEMNLTVREGISLENNFFGSHPAYRSLVPRCGVQNLARQLGKALMKQVRDSIPSVLSEVKTKLAATNRQIEGLGTPVPRDSASRHAHIAMMINRFATTYKDALDSRVQGMNYGRKIKDILVAFRQDCLSVNPFTAKDCSDQYLNDVLADIEGNKMRILAPSADLLENVLTDPRKRPIMRLENCIARCTTAIRAVLTQLSAEILAQSQYARFPNLCDYIRDAIVDPLLTRNVDMCNSRAREMLESEESYIWTDDAAFIKDIKAIVVEGKNNAIDAEKMRNILSCYFGIIKNTIAHLCPKMIMKFLVRNTEKNLQSFMSNQPLHAAAMALHQRALGGSGSNSDLGTPARSAGFSQETALQVEDRLLEQLTMEGDGMELKRERLRTDQSCLNRVMSVLGTMGYY